VTKRRDRPDWQQKLHPVFFEVAVVNREFEETFANIKQDCDRQWKALGKSASEESREAVRRQFAERGATLCDRVDARLTDINQRYLDVPHNRAAYSYLDSERGSPVDMFVAYVHWRRHRTSLEETEGQDAQGNISAWRKIARTLEDVRRIVFRKGLKPFQGDEVHRQLLELIICFERSPLTADERAECMNAYCACGKEDHEADALKKQYYRLKRELEAVLAARSGDKMD
jgi:hypothetical protein